MILPESAGTLPKTLFSAGTALAIAAPASPRLQLRASPPHTASPRRRCFSRRVRRRESVALASIGMAPSIALPPTPVTVAHGAAREHPGAEFAPLPPLSLTAGAAGFEVRANCRRREWALRASSRRAATGLAR